jgi:hypothetical protein
MRDHDEVGMRLAAALHEEADRVRPDPALQSILARTRRVPARSRTRRWWPALAGAVAAGGLVAAALVVIGARPTSEPAPATAQREVTVYMVGPATGRLTEAHLFPQPITAPDTGDSGRDAVNALLNTESTDPDYINPWWFLQERKDDDGMQPSAPVSVTSVTRESGVITVDFSGPIDEPWDALFSWVVDPRFFSQQLVWTVQDALDSKAPVLVTMNGEPVDMVLTAEVQNPIKRDPSALAPVQIEFPAQGETVSSPVTVSGQSATFEANVVWRVKQDGEVVERGFTTSKGANGMFGPFEFTVELPPGDYTVEAYEESAENGEVINLDSKDFTVEASATQPTTPTPSGETALSVYSVTMDGTIAAEVVRVPSTGEPGLDAVNALLAHHPDDPDYTNVWANLNSDSDPHATSPITATSVTEADGAVYVDFSGPVDHPYANEDLIDWAFDPSVFLQQLVWTVQTALDTKAPLVVTRDGVRVDALLGAPMSGIAQPDPYALAPVQIQSPTQGETVSSPVRVSGQSATFEANVVWRVKQDREVVARGFTTSKGANGVFGPFEFTVELPPGDYTVEAYEESAENGEVINLDSKDFRVE